MTTIEILNSLKTAGFPEKQAEAIVQAIEQHRREEVVTKDHLDARLAEFKADMQRWFMSTLLTLMLGQTAIILGAVYFMITHLK